MAELSRLGRYELRRVLGKGAMGVVYEGFDPALGRRVAVKTILKSVAIDDETARSYSERFVREAKAVARLNHPNIVQVHDFGEENEVAYLVMEFIQGRELRRFFTEDVMFEPAECVRIMGELLDALDFAHEAGVIHRDVKPANIMLDAQRRVKLTDFGVARVQDSDRSAAGTMVGTPAFMSPEQISGGKIDRRTDVFSAGTIFYQLLTGEQPFTGEGAWTVAKKIMQEDPPHPSSVIRTVPPVYDGIVSRAIAKNPAERYASAKDFAAALRAAIAGKPLPSVPATPPVPTHKPKPVPGTSDAEFEFWRSMQDSSDAAEFDAYLQTFPEGTYVRLARLKRSKLLEQLDDATVAMVEPNTAEASAGRKKRSFAVPAGVAAALVAGVAAYLLLGRTPAPAPVAQIPAVPAVPAPAPAPAPIKAEVSAADIEKITRETEERIHREYADKSAAEQAVAARLATEKAIQEKLLAVRIAAEKAAVEKSLAEKAAAEKAALEKAAAEKAVAAKAAEKSMAEKAVAEKVVAEKALAEKAAPSRAAASKPGWPGVRDRWVYEAREANNPEKKFRVVVEAQSVTDTSIRDVAMPEGGAASTQTHHAGALLVGIASGVASFSPYLQAFQELRGEQSWSSVEFDALWGCSNSMLACKVSGRVVGKERVSVRAGTYNAWKIVLELQARTTRDGGTGEFIYWFADEAKRFVKYQSRANIRSALFSQAWTQPDVDMELVSYTPAPAGSATAKAADSVAASPTAASIAAALEQFRLRHAGVDILDQEPRPTLGANVRERAIVYVNDKTCLEGEIKEITGGDFARGRPRSYRCVKLTE